MESTIRFAYDGENFDTEVTGEQTLKEIFECWYNTNTVSEELQTLDFYVGNEIYECDETAGLKKLNEIDKKSFGGLITVNQADEHGSIIKAVDDDTSFKVDLQMPKGIQQMELTSSDTILTIKQECVSKLQVEHVILQHRGKKCSDEQEMREFRKQ